MDTYLRRTLDTAHRIGLVRYVIKKLLGEPDRAAMYLGEAMSEVHDTLNSLRNAIQLVSNLDRVGPDDRELLRAIGKIIGGEILDVVDAKGSCTKIGNLYDAHIHAWLLDASIIRTKDRKELEKIFGCLQGSDIWVVDAMKKLVNDASPIAQRIKSEVNDAEAHKEAKILAQELEPILKELNVMMA